jgi:hypothetical protein
VAFGKKKSQDQEQPTEPVAEAQAKDGPVDAIGSELFASSDGASDAEPAGDSTIDEVSPPPAEAPVAAPAATPAADPLGGPDLLSMFQTTTVEADDRAALLELAGEVEIDDLLEDLQTVAAALGIKA